LSADGPRIGVMTRAELDLALDWAEAEGWDPALTEADCLAAFDAEGLLVARDGGGAPLACVAALRCGESLGRMSLLLVSPEARGRGLGRTVLRAGMERLGDRPCLVMDDLLPGLAKQRATGFSAAWTHERHVAARPSAPVSELRVGQLLLDARDAPFAPLVAFDAASFGFARTGFLRALFGGRGHVARAVLDPTDRPLGYGVLRPTRRGSRVGPLLAEDEQVAAALLAALLRAAPPGPVAMDLREDHAAAVALARSAGMSPAFAARRLYSAAPPAMRRDRVFAISGYEAG